MRRKFVVTIIFILAFLLSTAASALAADEQSIVRVKLSIGDPTEFSFFADGNYTVGTDGPGLERQLYTVKLEGGTLNLYCGSERLASGASIKIVRRAATDGRNNFIWMYNDRAQKLLGYDKFRYLGDMEFIIESGHITAVNHVYIEDYLCGVVPWEMSSSNEFPPEALKAQAVAARNYAEKHMGSDNPYDMVDTSKNQVYNGYSTVTTAANKAVTDTKGNVLTFGSPGSIIEAYFSASNGGFTDIPYHRWGSGSDWSYYQFSEDPFDVENPQSLFETITFPTAFSSYAEITKADNVTGDPDPLKAVELIKQSILDSRQLDVHGVTSRDMFVLTGVRSLVTMPGEYDINGNEDHSRIPATGPNNCVDIIKAKGNFTVAITGVTDPVTVDDVVIDLRYLDGSIASTNNEFKAFNADALTLFVVAPVKEGETVKGYSISQKRYGQGIGLSQRGAEQRAKSTDSTVNTFDKILGFYYPGTTLTVQGYEPPELKSASVPDHSNAALTTDLVNIRSGPGTSYSSLNRLPNGARVEVVQLNAGTANNYTWHKIYYAGQYGYVASNYVQPDTNPPSRTTIAVSFETNGGSPVSAPDYYHADSIAAAPSSSRAGFALEGWYYDAGLTSKVSFPIIVTRSTTLYAKWVSTVCTVNFDAAGGTQVAGVQKNYGDTIPSEPATSRPGYNFAGWFNGAGQRVSFPYTVTDNATLTARWNAQPQTNLLAGVGLSSGSLNRGFAKTVTSYKITIGENDGSFTLTPVKEYDGATMTINGKPYSNYTVNLANGKSTTIKVKVTFAKKSKTYKFTVTRAKSSNNALSSLSVIGGSLEQPFNPNVLNYTLNLDENTKSTTIKATAAAGKAASVSPSSKKISLNNGQSKDVKITVKAQSGAKRTYTIHVVRAASTNADLKSLKANGMAPGFSPGNTNYTIVLPANKSSASISAKAAGYKAAVYIDGAKKSSKKVTLANGQSTVVRVTVVSQAGNAKEYVITVIRQ